MNPRLSPLILTMEIEPATVEQIKIARDGRLVTISDDVGNVARDLRALHPTLRLRHSESAGHFIVYQEIEKSDGEIIQHLVTTAQQCDQRLVRRVAQIIHPSYDLHKELDKVEAESWEKIEDEMDEWIEDQGDCLAHAMRKDLGINKDSARSKKSWGKGKGIVGY